MIPIRFTIPPGYVLGSIQAISPAGVVGHVFVLLGVAAGKRSGVDVLEHATSIVDYLRVCHSDIPPVRESLTAAVVGGLALVATGVAFNVISDAKSPDVPATLETQCTAAQVPHASHRPSTPLAASSSSP